MFPMVIDGEWTWFEARTVWKQHVGVYHIFVGCIKSSSNCVQAPPHQYYVIEREGKEIPEQWYYIIREGPEYYHEHGMTEADLTVIAREPYSGYRERKDVIVAAQKKLRRHIDATITKLQNLRPEITKIDGNELGYVYRRPGGFVTEFCAREENGKWECYQASHSHVTDEQVINADDRKQAVAALTEMIRREVANDIMRIGMALEVLMAGKDWLAERNRSMGRDWLAGVTSFPSPSA